MFNVNVTKRCMGKRQQQQQQQQQGVTVNSCAHITITMTKRVTVSSEIS